MTDRPRSRGLRLVHSTGRGPSPHLRLLSSNPYGLTTAEVRAEARRCLACGWQLWEVRYRFATKGGGR
ncbi:hypothetical protein GCM10010420_39290 [Streptomyces glaucosporus]|uniref:Uncharacterized protein n=1 Tax=Streptomyces glaucosporus TaxID=284044 RepID=A0ABP5VPW6_9ACTN